MHKRKVGIEKIKKRSGADKKKTHRKSSFLCFRFVQSQNRAGERTKENLREVVEEEVATAAAAEEAAKNWRRGEKLRGFYIKNK
jgi:hypothetical protein